MNRIFAFTTSAVLTWSLATAQGATKPKHQDASNAPQRSLEQIDAWSATVADTAFSLGEKAKWGRAPEAQLEGLTVLREDVNRIGSGLRSLEADRGSLSSWQIEALDKILPLENDVAENVEKAIDQYNSDHRQLSATPYVEEIDAISRDAGQVAALLRDYLKLSKTRSKEVRIEQGKGDAAGL